MAKTLNIPDKTVNDPLLHTEFNELKNEVNDRKAELDARKIESTNLASIAARKDVGKNLLDPNDPNIISGYFLSSTGDLTESESYKITGYISIENGQTLKSSLTTGGAYVILYDENFQVLPGGMNNTSEIIGVAESKYCRWSFGVSDLSTIQIEIGETSTTFEAYTQSKSIEKKLIQKDEELQRKLDIKPGKNLFNKDVVTRGYFLSSSGLSLIESETFFVTDFIQVTAETTYMLTSIGYNSGGAFCSFYSIDNKEVISVIKGNELPQDGTLVTPENCGYIRLSGILSSIDIAQVELGVSKTPYEKYYEYIPMKALEESIVAQVAVAQASVSEKLDKQYGKNIFNKDAATRGYFLVSSGLSLTENESYFVTDFIKVAAETTYMLTSIGYNSGGAFCSFYSGNKEVISGVKGSELPQDGTLVTPVNCGYIRLSGVLSSIDIAQVELGTSKTSYEKYYEYLPMKALEESIVAQVAVVQASVSEKLDKQYGKNIFNKSDVVLGHYLSGDGFSEPVNEYYMISGYMRVLPERTYISTSLGYGASGAMNAFYNSSKELISTIASNDLPSSGLISTPANAAFMRMSGKVENLDLAQVEIGTIKTSYEAYTENKPVADLEKRLPDRDIECILPDRLFFAKSLLSSMYFENILFKQLSAPANIFFTEGTNYGRQVVFNFDTVATDQTMTGQVSANLMKGQQKSISYDVIDPTAISGKTLNILYIGDSFTDIGKWCKEITRLCREAGATVNEVGTGGNHVDLICEGLSGGRLKNTVLDATSGAARIITVSTPLTEIPHTSYPGTFYKDVNGKEWCYRGISNDGTKLRFTKFGETEPYFSDFPSSGILTKVDSNRAGDDVITYSSIETGYYNPFLNHSSGELDINHYLNFYGLTTPNLICIQFTWNDLSTWATDTQIQGVVDNFGVFADHIHTNLPDCKIVFSIEPYGSVNGNKNEWNGKKYTVLRFAEMMYEAFVKDSNYNTWTRVAPSFAFVDLVNGYKSGTVTPDPRYPDITERNPGDSVHPDEGMYQIGNHVFQMALSLIKDMP